MLRALLLPAAVVAVRYADGCRIRRVKVKALEARRRRTPNAPVIILSKRLLEQVRPARRTTVAAPAEPPRVNAA